MARPMHRGHDAGERSGTTARGTAALAVRVARAIVSTRACRSNLLRYGWAFVATVRQTVSCNAPIMGSVESLHAPRGTNGKDTIESTDLGERRGDAA